MVTGVISLSNYYILSRLILINSQNYLKFENKYSFYNATHWKVLFTPHSYMSLSTCNHYNCSYHSHVFQYVVLWPKCMEEQKCCSLVCEVPSQGSCEISLGPLAGRVSHSSLLSASEMLVEAMDTFCFLLNVSQHSGVHCPETLWENEEGKTEKKRKRY